METASGHRSHCLHYQEAHFHCRADLLPSPSIATSPYEVNQVRFIWKSARHAFRRRRENPWHWAMAITGLPNDLTVLPSRAIQASDVQYVGCHRLEIDDLSSGSCAALYFSRMHSRELHELVIAKPSKLHWRWLFYALFHKEASHSLTSLIIEDTDILLNDVATIWELIRSRQPLTMLMQPEYEALINDAPPVTSRPDSSSLPAKVTLPDGACIHLDPRMSSKGRVRTRIAYVDVMHGRNEEFDILVPGYSQCWVAHDDVVSSVPCSEDSLANRWNFKAHSISKLSISLKEGHLADIERGVRVLLRLVGTR